MKARWKILIAIGLGILASGLWQAYPASTKPTSRMLTNEFAYYNHKYFDDMPVVVDVQYGDLTDNDQMGVTIPRTGGGYLIVIDQKTNPILKIADGTLVHEMCHVKLNSIKDLAVGSNELDNHGPSFQACMLDIAAKGGFKDIW
jgi:hypothetical protein